MTIYYNTRYRYLAPQPEIIEISNERILHSINGTGLPIMADSVQIGPGWGSSVRKGVERHDL